MPTTAHLVANGLFGGPNAVALEQAADLFAAVALCGIIGLEREVRRKSAGLRTHSTVGLAAALIMIVSKYGFGDVIGPGVTLDPSRVAAQIVTGIGFVGAGLIFVRQDAVRGLTTAASVWLSAAIGMACGAHLIPLAAIGTAAYLLLSVVLYAVERRLPQPHVALLRIAVSYRGGMGALRQIMRRCVERDLIIVELTTPTDAVLDRDVAESGDVGVVADDESLVEVRMGLRGTASASDLLADILRIPGVVAVSGERGAEPD